MKISKQIPDQPEPSAIVSPLLTQALGSAVRELRQRHKLTIAQVSEQAGISRGMLSKIDWTP